MPAAVQAPAPTPSAGLESIMNNTEDSMMAVASCSNPDRFFAESMIPHHKVGAAPIKHVM